MKGNKKFMTFRFNSVLIRFLTLLFIFVSLGLQTTHFSHDKNDVTNLLSCNITSIFFSVRTDTKLEVPLPPPTLLTLKNVKMKIYVFMRKQPLKDVLHNRRL